MRLLEMTRKNPNNNDVLERLIEDVKGINEDTKKEIEDAIKEIESGKYVTHEKLAKEMGF